LRIFLSFNSRDMALAEAIRGGLLRLEVTASDDKTARLWDVFRTTGELIDDAKTKVPRCLTRERREAAFLEPAPPAWCIELEKWPYHTAEWKQWLASTRAGKNPPLPASR
jgi:hypothetical protein